ncbi:oligosaccharide flippase family protein [Bacteroides thetaiotaomicron]|nr:oligosaccharide flippase family protein [Bacteroides thetaiotaomicron]
MILVKKYSRLSDSRKNIIKNLFWAILGKVVNVLGALFVGILVARYLGPSQYGLMNYVISYVTIFMVLSAFGLDNIEIRELSRKKVEKMKF